MRADAETRYKIEAPDWELLSVQLGALRTARGGEQAACGAEGGACGCGGGVVLGPRKHARGGGGRARRLAPAAYGASRRDALLREPSDAGRRRVRHLLAPVPGLSGGISSGNRRGGHAGADRGLARPEAYMAI